MKLMDIHSARRQRRDPVLWGVGSGDQQDGSLVSRLRQTAVQWQARLGVEDHSGRLKGTSFDIPSGQLGIIGECRADSDAYGVGGCTHAMHPPPRGRARDPLALTARRRDLAIEARSELQRHLWAAGQRPGNECRIQLAAGALVVSIGDSDLHTGLAQHLHALCSAALQGIERSDDDSADSRLQENRATRWGPAVVGARLQGADNGGTARIRDACQGGNLRMRLARPGMPPLPDHLSISHDHSANQWVRTDVAFGLERQLARACQ
jgi:hypothetical protein